MRNENFCSSQNNRQLLEHLNQICLFTYDDTIPVNTFIFLNRNTYHTVILKPPAAILTIVATNASIKHIEKEFECCQQFQAYGIVPSQKTIIITGTMNGDMNGTYADSGFYAQKAWWEVQQYLLNIQDAGIAVSYTFYNPQEIAALIVAAGTRNNERNNV